MKMVSAKTCKMMSLTHSSSMKLVSLIKSTFLLARVMELCTMPTLITIDGNDNKLLHYFKINNNNLIYI